MNAAPAAKLYTPEMLGLAVSLSDFPFHPGFTMTGSARSQSCGSTLKIGMTMDKSGLIDTIGLQVSACAIGQAAAAIFAKGAAGQSADHIAASLSAIEGWLAGTCDGPDWPGLKILDPARDLVGRRGAILLPWRAAAAALCKQPSTS